MRIALVGPGRAGMALALAAMHAGHTIVSVSGRRPEAVDPAAAMLGAESLPLDAAVAPSALILIAVRDDAIAEVASSLVVPAAGRAVHMSGAASIDVLDGLRRRGLAVGSFHPLQTLPSPEAGAAALPGSWIGVTADEPLRSSLFELAGTIGATAFDLADDAKPLYHAAAAAAANFPLVALMMAERLFTAAGVPFAAARPLVEAVVANAFDLGPKASLTGPVARGDVGTVQRQLAAVVERAPEWVETYRVFVARTAAAVGRSDEFSGTVR
jgi:predicted short-subunit dehydrogenase-like oxidoreductase (DUF2520 family)